MGKAMFNNETCPLMVSDTALLGVVLKPFMNYCTVINKGKIESLLKLRPCFLNKVPLYFIPLFCVSSSYPPLVAPLFLTRPPILALSSGRKAEPKC
jgi:hypothetical protein